MIRARMLVLATLFLAGAASAGGVISSKHDLSTSGPGPIRAIDETRVCIFCHISHGADELGQNRPEGSAIYRLYESTTMRSNVAFSPTGASRLCLSCHDGTIALGETLSTGTIRVVGADPSGRLPPGPSNLGTDLRRSHPVSFLPAPSDVLRPLAKDEPVKLDRTGQVQCTSCHDPHIEDVDPVRRKFLVKSSRFSELCVTCHAVPYWQSNPSSHQASQVPLGPQAAGKYPFATVAENGCESCHRSHQAGEQGRLLRSRSDEPDEQVCLDCHNGFVARTDIASAAVRPFSHIDARPGPRLHDASEGPSNTRFQLPERSGSALRHATCVDCHNPHAAFQQDATAPRIKGANVGTWGIDVRGDLVDPARFEYELCFKCHGDSANQPQARGLPRIGVPRRAIVEPNLRLQIAPEAPSAHPVAQPGRAMDVPSLLPPYITASQIYCTDCHSSDSGRGAGGLGPRGPHGSSYPFLLERNLSTADQTIESRESYALCYKCHDRDVLLSDASAFRLHRRHVVDSATPCTACHVSHGVAPLQGNPVNNAHLVDFDTGIVQATSGGVRQYTSLGPRTGTCSVACHGVEHNATPY